MQVPDGPDLLLGIRPEDMTIDPAGAGSPLKGTVSVAEPLGPVTLLGISLGRTAIRAAVPPDMSVRPSDTVGISLTPDRVRWFDAKTQAAVTA